MGSNVRKIGRTVNVLSTLPPQGYLPRKDMWPHPSDQRNTMQGFAQKYMGQIQGGHRPQGTDQRRLSGTDHPDDLRLSTDFAKIHI